MWLTDTRSPVRPTLVRSFPRLAACSRHPGGLEPCPATAASPCPRPCPCKLNCSTGDFTEGWALCGVTRQRLSAALPSFPEPGSSPGFPNAFFCCNLCGGTAPELTETPH